MNKYLISFLILSNIYITISLKAGFLDYDEVTDFDENNSEFSFVILMEIPLLFL